MNEGMKRRGFLATAVGGVAAGQAAAHYLLPVALAVAAAPWLPHPFAGRV